MENLYYMIKKINKVNRKECEKKSRRINMYGSKGQKIGRRKRDCLKINFWIRQFILNLQLYRSGQFFINVKKLNNSKKMTLGPPRRWN